MSQAARISSALHSEVPQYSALPDATMSCMAHTVSSMGVSGSGRWQNTRSTKSRPSRSSEPSIAWRRYLRFSVLDMFTRSDRPQKNFVEIVKESRGQPSWRMARPMMRSESPPAYASALSKKLTPAS
jgi:hypothetical protein